MPPFHPEAAALSRHFSLNTKATCAQPLAVLRALAKVSGESFARPFFAVAHGHFRFSQKVVVAYAFCRFTMSHSHTWLMAISKSGFARSSKQKRQQVGVSEPEL